MNGTSPTTFNPDAAMGRSMAATVLWRLAGSPAADGRTGFFDVPDGAWYAEAAGWAAGCPLMTNF